MREYLEKRQGAMNGGIIDTGDQYSQRGEATQNTGEPSVSASPLKPVAKKEQDGGRGKMKVDQQSLRGPDIIKGNAQQLPQRKAEFYFDI